MATNLYGLIERRPEHPNLGLPFYVGIGGPGRPRAHIRHAKSALGCRNRMLNTVIREHVACGVEPGVAILATYETRQEADAAEREAIVRLGRMGRDEGGILCNVASGGDGPDPSLMADPEILAKISEAARRQATDPAMRARMTARLLEVWSDPALRQRQSESLRKAYSDPVLRAKVGAATARALRQPETRKRHLEALARINGSFTRENYQKRQAGRSAESIARSTAALLLARENPEIEARRRENSRDPSRAAWADPEIRARRVAGMRGKPKTMTPEALAARRANAKRPRSEEALAASRAATIRRWEAHRQRQAAERAASSDLPVEPVEHG